MEGKPVNVLFAEDTESHAKLVIRSLRDHLIANKIFHVRDGEEALDFLLRRSSFADPECSPRPDLILLDLRLPKVDGLEVLRFVKQHETLKQLPVVILTTSDAESDIARAYELQANSYLIKPLDFEMFTALMQDLGFYWLAWNQSPNL